MSFFRYHSLIINSVKRSTKPNVSARVVEQPTLAEPALIFNTLQKFASVREIPPAPVERIPIKAAARFPTLRRIMSRTLLKRGKA